MREHAEADLSTGAAIAVACIYERAGEITSAGNFGVTRLDWRYDNTPALQLLLHRLNAEEQHTQGRRVIRLSNPNSIGVDDVAAALAELEVGQNVMLVSTEQIAAIAVGIGGLKPHAAISDIRLRFQKLVGRRWDEVLGDLAQATIHSVYHRREILTVLPQILKAPEFLDALSDALEEKSTSYLGNDFDFDQLAVPTRNQLRRMLANSARPESRTIALLALSAQSQREGWSPWLTLFSALFLFPQLTATGHVRPPNDYHENEVLQQAALDGAWRAVKASKASLGVARLVQDLSGVLHRVSPDFRTVYVQRLKDAIGNDDDLRKAAIEALIWQGAEENASLAVYAAVELTVDGDQELLAELKAHLDRAVQYRSHLISDALNHHEGVGENWPISRQLALAEGVVSRSFQRFSDGQDAKTWLSDRLLERMIEEVAASVEMNAADEYPKHYGSGEEKLLERFFTRLSLSFEHLSNALSAAGNARMAQYQTSISAQYRPVDKAEEGRPGIPRGDDTGDELSFSADLCIVVHPFFGGKSLGKRATLIQAKRLYPNEVGNLRKGWRHSFSLDPKQLSDLLRQTGSSVYLFQAPLLAGRGIPIIPTQLVSDLAFNQSPSGGVIGREIVSVASQSFSEWFTYELLALRIGDPYEPLVAKAERGPGSDPYDLVRLGTVEVEVRVNDPKGTE